jgi:hypothetical protein
MLFLLASGCLSISSISISRQTAPQASSISPLIPALPSPNVTSLRITSLLLRPCSRVTKEVSFHSFYIPSLRDRREDFHRVIFNPLKVKGVRGIICGFADILTRQTLLDEQISQYDTLFVVLQFVLSCSWLLGLIHDLRCATFQHLSR